MNDTVHAYTAIACDDAVQCMLAHAKKGVAKQWAVSVVASS